MKHNREQAERSRIPQGTERAREPGTALTTHPAGPPGWFERIHKGRHPQNDRAPARGTGCLRGQL